MGHHFRAQTSPRPDPHIIGPQSGAHATVRTAAGLQDGSTTQLLIVQTGTHNHFAGVVVLDSVDDARSALDRDGTTGSDLWSVNARAFVNNAV